MDVSMTLVIVALVLGTTGPSSVSAQDSHSSATAGLAHYVGKNVRVTDAARTKLRGTLIAVRDDQIDLMTKAGARTLDVDTITRVERRGDSVRNGLRNGAIFGVAACGTFHPVFLALCAFNWGWVGGLIDALHRGWTPVYVR